MPDDLDTLALRVHQIAATAAVLAEAAAQPTSQEEALSHALYLLAVSFALPCPAVGAGSLPQRLNPDLYVEQARLQ